MYCPYDLSTIPWMVAAFSMVGVKENPLTFADLVGTKFTMPTRPAAGTPTLGVGFADLRLDPSIQAYIRTIPTLTVRVDDRDVMAFLSTVGLGHTRDETHWCSAFANWCMQQACITGPKKEPGRARSWLAWGGGVPISKPMYGAIVILWRGKKDDGRSGHVGFCVAANDKKVFLLGGNQSDAVKVSEYPTSQLLGYRWPMGYPNSAIPLPGSP